MKNGTKMCKCFVVLPQSWHFRTTPCYLKIKYLNQSGLYQLGMRLSLWLPRLAVFYSNRSSRRIKLKFLAEQPKNPTRTFSKLPQRLFVKAIVKGEGRNLRFWRQGKMFASFVGNQDIMARSAGIAWTALATVVGDFVNVDLIAVVADVDPWPSVNLEIIIILGQPRVTESGIFCHTKMVYRRQFKID